MSKLTTAQKTRIGVFLVVALGLMALTVFVKLGETLFASRDHYFVRVSGGVGGLQPGADVGYNGIVVGKVIDVSVDPKDVALVRLDLALKEGTPVPEDAVATVVIQGISGTRRVDLTGGTNAARRRAPGEEIPLGRSVLDEVAQTVETVVAEMKEMSASISRLVNGEGVRRIEATLANAEAASASLAALLIESRPRVAALLAEAGEASKGVNLTLDEFRETAGRVRTAIGHLEGTLRTVDRTARTVDGLVATEVTSLVRSAKGAVEHIEAAAGNIEGAVGRAQSRFQVVMSDFSDGIRDIADLANMLKADPSSIVQGRTWPARESP